MGLLQESPKTTAEATITEYAAHEKVNPRRCKCYRWGRYWWKVHIADSAQ